MGRSMQGVSAAAAGAAIGAFVLVAVVHLGDNFRVDHVAGAWMALAAYADGGVLYPPLHAGGSFAGTRYAPLGILLNAGAAKVTGEYLTSGKLVAFATTGALLIGLYVAARRAQAPRLLAFAAVGAAIASFTVQFAGTSIYGDVLATALQVWAIAVLARDTGPRAAALAGALVVLAVSAKISALWGGAAALTWLALRAPRSLPAFAAAGAAAGLAGFGFATAVSDGRIADNLLGLGGSGFSGVGDLVTDTPWKIAELLARQGEATLILTPVALALVVVAAARRRMELPHIAFAYAGLLTLVVMTDVGTGFNHLLDLAVLAPLVVAVGPARMALAALLAFATAVSLVADRGVVRQALAQVVNGAPEQHLRTPALDLRLSRPYFTEDPTVAVQRGHRPVAMDSFMLLRLMREHPDWREQLVERFDRREFRTVVLLMDLDLRDPWWAQSHLGLAVARAIDRNYRFTRRIQGPVFAYRVFEPR